MGEDKKQRGGNAPPQIGQRTRSGLALDAGQKVPLDYIPCFVELRTFNGNGILFVRSSAAGHLRCVGAELLRFLQAFCV
jgi:hypothetical protein